VGRTVTAPVDHRGEPLEVGTNLLMTLWGADHDGTAYPDPERFDAEREDPVPHLAFGHGPHHCLGAALARAELVDALSGLTARISCPRIGAGSTWRAPIGITGPERLPVTFTTH
jgi:cytochrome P450